MKILIDDLKKIDEAAKLIYATISTHKIIAFEGEMGAGKTTLIKSICKLIGVKDVINSPTFSIINQYNVINTNEIVYHFDFYRINNQLEVCDLGVEDYLNSGNLCFIEWAEKVKPLLPKDTIYVQIYINKDNSRSVSIL